MDNAKPLVRLYIAAGSQNSIIAEDLLRIAITGRDVALEVIDVRSDPPRALREGIFVTPMLVIEVGGRRTVLVGTPADTATLAAALGPSG